MKIATEGRLKQSFWSLQRLTNIFKEPYPEGSNILLTDEDFYRNFYSGNGNGIKFDGTFYLENASPSDIPSGGTNRSMFGWVKPDTTTSLKVLFGYGPTESDPSNDENFLLFNKFGNQEICFWGEGINFAPGDPSNTLTADIWNFVGMTWDSTNLTLYINSYSSTTTVTLNTTVGVFRVALGTNGYSTHDNLFVGYIRDLGVWDVALTSDVVTALFNAGPSDYADLPSVDYDLVDESGNFIIDQDGNDILVNESVGGDLISFWNLSENNGSRLDSVGDNNLTPYSN